MRSEYSMNLSRSPFALYASAALLNAMMLFGSVARISFATLMIESGDDLAKPYAVSRHSRPSVDGGYACMVARASAIAASYFAARRSFSQVLYGRRDLRASPSVLTTSRAASPTFFADAGGNGWARMF